MVWLRPHRNAYLNLTPLVKVLRRTVFKGWRGHEIISLIKEALVSLLPALLVLWLVGTQCSSLLPFLPHLCEGTRCRHHQTLTLAPSWISKSLQSQEMNSMLYNYPVLLFIFRFLPTSCTHRWGCRELTVSCYLSISLLSLYLGVILTGEAWLEEVDQWGRGLKGISSPLISLCFLPCHKQFCHAAFSWSQLTMN